MEKAKFEGKISNNVGNQIVDGFAATAKHVRSFSSELWMVFAMKYLESYSYFILSYCLVIYVSQEFGFSDADAGWVYGIYGMLVSLYGFLMGTVIDTLGVRRSVNIGLVLLLLSRLALAMTSSSRTLLLVLFTTLPVGGALTLPVMQIAVKRYTTPANRSIAFSAYYIVMNLSAMTAAPCIDMFHRMFPDQVAYHGMHFSSYRLLIFTGAILTLFSLFISHKCLRGEDSPATEHLDASTSPVNVFRRVLSSAVFWRFVLLTVLLLGVRMIYRHLDATFPKYMLRVFGADAPYGSIIALNPLCVVFVVILTSPLSAYFSAVPLILVGSLISSVSPFILAASASSSYTSPIMFVVFLSLGEGIWSPRLYEYTVQIAETGREGTYMALASAPMFLATLLTGATSGVLLETFCPAVGEKHPERMWLIIGLVSLLSPMAMFALRHVIAGPPTVAQTPTPALPVAGEVWIDSRATTDEDESRRPDRQRRPIPQRISNHR